MRATCGVKRVDLIQFRAGQPRRAAHSHRDALTSLTAVTTAAGMRVCDLHHSPPPLRPSPRRQSISVSERAREHFAWVKTSSARPRVCVFVINTKVGRVRNSAAKTIGRAAHLALAHTHTHRHTSTPTPAPTFESQ